MVSVTVKLPDDVASRAAAVAAERGVSVDELASEAIEAYLGDQAGRELGFVALGEAEPGYSARLAEEQLEAEGFEPSRSS